MPLTLPTIYTSSLKLLSKQSSAVMYELVMKEAMKVARGTCGSLHISDHGTLVTVLNTCEVMPKIRKNGFTTTTYLTQQPSVIAKAEVDIIHPESRPLKGNSWIYIPLAFENTAFGVLNILSKLSVDYINHHIKELLIFGTMVTLAIKNADAMGKMEQAIKTRDTFISLTHHELKTPLTTIMAYAHLTHKALQEKTMPQQKWVAQILSEAERQKRIIDELYTVDQMNAGTLIYNFKLHDVVKLMQTIVKDAQVRNSNRTIQYKNELEKAKKHMVKADADKLNQAIGNLINNALKYSEQDIEVHLSKENGTVLISIADQGKGIKAQDLPHLFTLFKRGRHETTTGLGVGLYLAKQIVEAHHGTIQVESRIGRRTTFTLHLPLA